MKLRAREYSYSENAVKPQLLRRDNHNVFQYSYSENAVKPQQELRRNAHALKYSYSENAVKPQQVAQISEKSVQYSYSENAVKPQQIEWDDGDSYARESDFVKALAKALNWPAAALDAAWQEIAAIE